MPDEVTVIVPVWNGRPLVERLIGSLRAQTYAVAEILIIDNAPEDGAPEAAEVMGARVIRMGSNTGFAGREPWNSGSATRAGWPS